MKTSHLFLLTAVLASLSAGQVHAERVVLSPVQTLRIVNPSSPDDVRIFFRFEIPDDVIPSGVIDATLRVRMDDWTEDLFSVGPLRGSWSESDTWGSLASRFSSDDGFKGNLPNCAIGSVHNEQTEETANEEPTLDLSVNAGNWVSAWAESDFLNNGVCVRRAVGTSANVSGMLIDAWKRSELEIVYVVR